MPLFVFSLSSSAYYKSNLAATSNFCRFTGSLVFWVHFLVLIGTFVGLILAKRLRGLILIIGPVLVASGASVCANFPHIVVHGVMYFMTGLGVGIIWEVIPIWLLQIAPEGERDRINIHLLRIEGEAESRCAQEYERTLTLAEWGTTFSRLELSIDLSICNALHNSTHYKRRPHQCLPSTTLPPQAASSSSSGITSSSTALPPPAAPAHQIASHPQWCRLLIHGVAFFKQRPAHQVASHPQWCRLLIHGVAFFKQRPAHQVASHPQWRRLRIHGVASSGGPCSSSGVASSSGWRRILNSVVSSSMVSPSSSSVLLNKWRRLLLIKSRRILSVVVSSSTASPYSSSVLLIKWRRLLQGVSCLSSGAASSMASSPHPRRRVLQAASCSSSGVTSASMASPSSSSVQLVKWRRILNDVVSSSTVSPSHQVASPPQVASPLKLHKK
nr:sugar carrier protein A-like [Ipomoea batatas]